MILHRHETLLRHDISEVCEQRFFVSLKSYLLHFLPIAAALSQPCLATRGLAEMNVAVSAHDYSLSMRKDGSNLKASRAFDIHEVRIWGLHQPLKLVCAGFYFWRRV